MIRAFLFLSIALITQPAFSQDKDLFSIRYGVSSLNYNDTAAYCGQLQVRLGIPLYHQQQYTVAGMIGYRNIHLQHFPGSFASELHGVHMQLAGIYKLSDRKSITCFALLGAFSDMRAMNWNSVRYNIGFRFRIRHSYKLSTGWGLAYSKQFFGNQIVPFIDLDYRPGNRWSITGQFPIKPKILYRINRKTNIGLEVSGDASSYRLYGPETSNGFIQINQWTGIFKCEYTFTKACQLNVGIGTSFRQTYKLYDGTSENSWTIITIPLSSKTEPIRQIDAKGIHATIGLYFNPFNR